MTTQIIGICGKKFHGKDTIADYLVRTHGYTKVSFGDSTKFSLQSIFGFSYEQLWGNEKEKIDDFWKVTPREIMQYFGTDMFRIKFASDYPDIGDKIWIMSLQKKIDVLITKNITKIVIPDLRFPNEAEFIKNLNGKIIRVIRPVMNNTDMHSSENSSDNIDVDYTLNNNTKEQLYVDIENMLLNINKK